MPKGIMSKGKGSHGRTPSTTTAKDAPGDKRRQQIMVAGTVILVAFGYLALRKQGSSSASGNSTPVAATPTDTGAAADGTDATTQSTYAAQLNSLAGQMTQLAKGETDLESAIKNIKPTTTTTNNYVTNTTNNYTDHVPHVIHPPNDVVNKDSKKKNGTVQHPATQSGSATHYTVKQGDTLSAIAKRFGVKWQDIYTGNKGEIESTAKAHGKSSASGPDKSKGWWIYPGEVFNIVTKKKAPTGAGTTKKTNPPPRANGVKGIPAPTPAPHNANGVKIPATQPHPANGVKGISTPTAAKTAKKS